jgi:hypothetical protein
MPNRKNNKEEKMGYPNYKVVEEYLSCSAPFKHGNSMSAEWVDGEYVVWSYRTVVARMSLVTGKKEWWVNPNRYSVTTSKQQTIIRRVAKLDGWIDKTQETPLLASGVKV